jgi:hypothetical protein
MISHIVGRCHAGQDYLSVLRYVISQTKGKRRNFLKTWARADKRWLIRETFREHRANRAIYTRVMGGI